MFSPLASGFNSTSTPKMAQRWRAKVLDPNGVEFEYKIFGPQKTEAEIAEWVATYYRNVTFICAWRDYADDSLPPGQPPPDAKRIPPSHYQCGALAAAQAELLGLNGKPLHVKRPLIPRKLFIRR